MPVDVKHWSLTTLREKLIKIGAKMAHHARSVVFQTPEVAVPRKMLRLILERIGRLRLTSVSAVEPPTEDDNRRRAKHATWPG